MNATMTLTHVNGTGVSVTVSKERPYVRFAGTGLGLFYLEDPGSDEFALWLQNGAIDDQGRASGGGLDHQKIRVEFDEPVESLDGRCIRDYAMAQTLIESSPTPHYLPHGSQTIRRFVKATRALRAKRRLIVDNPLKSRWPTLPTSPGFWTRRVQRLVQAVTSGKADLGLNIMRDRVGLFFPSGDPQPGAPGGEGIYMHFGYEPDDNAAWFHRMMMDLAIDRQRTACFDALTGRQITAEDWIARAGSVPWYRTSESALEPHSVSQSPEAGPLRSSFTGYDDEHFIRALGPAIAAWAQLRDPVAQKFLEQLAHHSRGVRCELNGGRIAGQLQQALAAPGSASANLGRAFGWHAFSQACAIWCGAGSRGIRANAEACVRLCEVSAMGNGCAGRNTAQYSSGGITTPWDIGLWSKAFDHIQPFEDRIVHNGLFACLAQLRPEFGVPPGRLKRILGLIPPAAKIMLRAVDQLTDNQRLGLHRYQYNLYSLSPPKYVVVADAGGAPHRTLQMGGAEIQEGKPKDATGDPTHLLHDLALAYRMSGDAKYLDRIRALDVPASTLAAKKAALLSVFVQSGDDYHYQQAEQSRAWGLESLSVLP